MSTPQPPDPASAIPPLKAKMRAWAEQHPAETADRRAARERIRSQRKAAVVLSQLIGPEMIEKAVERLDQLLDAEQAVVVNLPPVVTDGKVVSGGQEVQFVADNKTQLEAIKVVAAYTEGLPVQRQVNLQVDFATLSEERKELMRRSPAVLEALADLEESGFQYAELGEEAVEVTGNG